MATIDFSNIPEVFYNNERQKYVYFNNKIVWPYDEGSVLKYPITLNDNGGTIDYDNWVSKNYNTYWIRTTNKKIPLNTLPTAGTITRTVKSYSSSGLSNEAITFKGWTKTQNGTDFVTEESTIFSGPSFIYAKWYFGDSRTVSFDSNGGKESYEDMHTDPATGRLLDKYNKLVGALPTPTHSDTTKTFDGWYLNRDTSSNKITINSYFHGNVVCYAHWKLESTSSDYDGGVILGKEFSSFSNGGATNWIKPTTADHFYIDEPAVDFGKIILIPPPDLIIPNPPPIYIAGTFSNWRSR